MGIFSSIMNFAMNERNNEFNERMTREAWAREDNAVQRRAADLEAAGMNPLLAAGDAASASQAIPHQAAQVDMADPQDMVMSLISGITALKKQQLDMDAQTQQMMIAAQDATDRHDRNLLEQQALFAKNRYLNWQLDKEVPHREKMFGFEATRAENEATLSGHRSHRSWMDMQFREVYKQSFGVYPPEYIPHEALIPLMIQQAVQAKSGDVQKAIDAVQEELQNRLADTDKAIERTMMDPSNQFDQNFNRVYPEGYHGGSGRQY